MTGNKRKGQKGFTLVELLVVMAIMAVLIGISVAGLGYALRRSRNIARSASMSNLDKAFASYYADNQDYPADGSTIEDLVASSGDLDVYLEGTWDGGPPGSKYYYKAGNSDTIYSVCVSQEKTATVENFVCLGPGVGSTGWPDKEQSTCSEAVCGEESEWSGTAWE